MHFQQNIWPQGVTVGSVLDSRHRVHAVAVKSGLGPADSSSTSA